MGRGQALAGLAAYVVYFFVLQLYLLIQKVYRIFTKTDKVPEGHARICSILYRRKRDIEEISRDIDFLTSHNCFVETSFLDDPKWALYSIDKNFAYFVFLPRPYTDYNAQLYPFVYTGLFYESLLFAQVARKDFENFADELGKRAQPQTILYTNTARCGSTLLAKMLHVEGKSHCMAEPYPLPNLTIGVDEGYFTEEDVRSLLPRVINCLRAHIPSDQICVIKTESTGARLVQYSDNVQQLKHIFSFRKNGIDSVERVLKREEILDLLTSFYLAFPDACNWICGFLTGMEGKLTKTLKPDTHKKRAAIVYASPYGEYLRHESRFVMPCIWFHDLIHDTENTLRTIFRNIGIPEECAVEAAKWKGEDSQKGTFLSQDKLKHITTPKMTDDEKIEMERYAEAMGVPLETLLSE